MRHFLYLFLCMAVRQFYKWRMRDLRGFLGIKKMDRAPNVQIRDLCGVRKSLDEKIDGGILRWFGHLERMERDMIATRVYVGEGRMCW